METLASRCFFLGGLATSEMRGRSLARDGAVAAVDAGDDEGGTESGNEEWSTPEETVLRRCFPDWLCDMSSARKDGAVSVDSAGGRLETDLLLLSF